MPNEPVSEQTDPALKKSGLFSRLTLDVSLLKTNRNFRNLWLSSLITRFGSMITYVAVPYQIKELTGSYIAVGLIAVFQVVPLIFFGLYGGSIADRYDRKKVVLWCELGFLSLVTALMVNSLSASPSIWIIYVVGMLMSALDGIQRPSLTAMTPRLVTREQLPAASALDSITHNAGYLVGTSLGGLLVVSVGLSWSYLIDLITYAISGIFLLLLPGIKPTSVLTTQHFSSILEGASYAWNRKDLLGTYLIDTAAMVFAFPNALFPFLADHLDSPQALGLLYSSSAIGSIIATSTSGWVKHVRRHGMAVVYAAALWGVGIAIVGLTDSLTIALLGLIIAGGADTISGLFRSLIWNTSIPDELRGRLAGIELLSYSIGPHLGQLRASFSANFFGLQRALISGGVLCTISVLALARALPSLRNYLDLKENSAISNQN